MTDSEEVESQDSLLLRTVLGVVLHVLGTLGVAAGFQDGVSPGCAECLWPQGAHSFNSTPFWDGSCRSG